MNLWFFLFQCQPPYGFLRRGNGKRLCDAQQKTLPCRVTFSSLHSRSLWSHIVSIYAHHLDLRGLNFVSCVLPIYAHPAVLMVWFLCYYVVISVMWQFFFWFLMEVLLFNIHINTWCAEIEVLGAKWQKIHKPNKRRGNLHHGLALTSFLL